MTSTASPLFDTVLIVGIGHIGSSVAVNIRHAGLARRLLASDQSADHEAIAVSLGHVDAVLPLEEAAGQADLVILCAPVGAVEAICEKIAPHLKDNCIVSDVGSTKLSVLQAMERQLGNNVHAVPAHPIAGIEKSGPTQAIPALFQNRWAVITPSPHASEDAVRKGAGVMGWLWCESHEYDRRAPRPSPCRYQSFTALDRLLYRGYSQPTGPRPSKKSSSTLRVASVTSPVSQVPILSCGAMFF